MSAGKRKLQDGEELVQSPANPATQVDKDDLDSEHTSAEGYPTLRQDKDERSDKKR